MDAGISAERLGGLMKFARLGNNIINLEQIAYLEVAAEVVTIHLVGVSEKLKLFGEEAAMLTDLIGVKDTSPKDEAMRQIVARIVKGGE